MGHKEVPQNWLFPICPGYFRNSKWPFRVLSISSFCGPGLSVIRSGLRKVLSLFSISPLSHLPFPCQPTTIELSNPSILTKQPFIKVINYSILPNYQKVVHFTHCILSSQHHLKETLPPVSFCDTKLSGPGSSLTFHLLVAPS